MAEDAATRSLKGLGVTLAGISTSTAETASLLFRGEVGGPGDREGIERFIGRLIPVVRQAESRATRVVQGTYTTARRSAGVRGRMLNLPAIEEFNEESFRRSLDFLARARPEQREREGVSQGENRELTSRMIEGSVVRRITDAGMRRMERITRSDRAAIGYTRVTDADPCYFCSMLASRGPVYTAESFIASDRRFRDNDFPPEVLSGELVAKVHDHCQCILAPVWSKDSTLHKEADEMYETWKRVQKEYAHLGLDMINTWRRYWENRVG